MSSKYDTFWMRQLPELRKAVAGAASGYTREITVSEIRSLGKRASWNGTAVIRGATVLSSSMAHMRSLANSMVGVTLCSAWPEMTFRFAMGSDGTVLSVTAPRPNDHRGPAVQEAGRRPAHGTVAPALGAAARQSGVEPSLDPTVACAEVHALLQDLPLLRTPSEVPFSDGLYVFFEKGESSAHAPRGRIVRVGNHPRAQHRLVRRLGDHYRGQDGAKNGSVFRRYIGGAILRRLDPTVPCLAPGPGGGHWEQQGEPACPTCSPTERAVSALLDETFRFRCIRIDDQEERNHMESRLIATIAACTVCSPSQTWLGLHAYPPLVRASGLWNVQHVGRPTVTRTDLQRLVSLVDGSQSGRNVTSDRLDDTLLLIPCIGGKRGTDDPGLTPVQLADLIGATSAELLAEGRHLAFAHPRVKLDEASPLRPAIAYYTGQPYNSHFAPLDLARE